MDYNLDCVYMIFGGCNVIMSIIGLDVVMCGLLWVVMYVVIVECFKEGCKVMDLIFGGVGLFCWGINIGLLLMFIVSLVELILGVVLVLMLLI